MKHIPFILCFAFSILLLTGFASFAYAGFGYIPFGGRITSTTDGVTLCGGTYHPAGVLTIRPSSGYISYPIAIPLSSRVYGVPVPLPGTWVLGFINPIPSDTTSCGNPETGAPVPVFDLNNLGTSRF